MNNLVQITNNNEYGYVVSSRVIAAQLEKRHDHVIRDLENIVNSDSPNLGSLIIPSEYKTKGQTRTYKEYLLTKDGFTLYMFNIQGYNDFKIAYINKFNELEQRVLAPRTMKEALQLALKQQEELEEKNILIASQSMQIGELQPKADYLDKILTSKSLITTTAIAKDYGMSASKFNKILHELGVQYKQGNQWFLYSRYHANGYTSSETVSIVRSDGRQDTVLNTKWTQKGRLFLYELLKKQGYLPKIEQEL